jgi:hypothetical protein
VLDLTTRGYEGSDAQAVSDLINLIENEAGGHGGLTAGSVDTMFRLS